MIGQANYYTQTEAEDAMSVIAGWIGSNRNIRVQFHGGSAVDANIKTGLLRIPRMACASGITQEALMLLRSRVYHEAGHIDETDVDKPQGALGEILNALEDRRMEASESRKHKGCEVAFRWATDWYNKDIAAQVIAGNVNAPLWEALCGMVLMVEGVQPAWTLSKKAQAYVDAAYDEFAKVTLCKNTTDCLELAKEILALLKDANEQYKKENPNPPQQQGQQGQKQQKQDGEPQDGEPQSSGQGDLDEENEGEEQEDKSGKSEEDGEDKEDKSGKGSKSKDDGDKDEDDSDGDGDSDSESDEEGEDGKSGKDDSDGDEDGDSDSEEDGDSNGKGEDGEDESKGNGSDGDDSESDEDGNEEDGNEEDADGKKEDGPDADGSYTPDDSRRGEKTTGEGEDEDEDPWKDTSLDDEIQGRSKEDAINEAIEEFFDEMDPADADYLSRRDLDEHRIPMTRDGDRATFKNDREQVAVMAASMTRALEQALRSLCRCKRQGYMRQGRLDHKRLVAICKGLSKEIFFKIRDGQKMEVAVEIVLDESGSMSNYRQVRLLAIAIGEALDAIGVPFEITGTTTKYGMGAYGCPSLDGMTRTNPINYNHYVMFGEKWQAVRHRLVHTGAHVHNIDGEAIEYCVFRLHQRPERRKVVFSLSDGQPCGGQGTDSDLAQNIVRVCQKARKSGVEVYGFGIGTQLPKQYYGNKFFVFMDDLTTMSQTFIRKFAEVITGGQVRV